MLFGLLQAVCYVVIVLIGALSGMAFLQAMKPNN